MTVKRVLFMFHSFDPWAIVGRLQARVQAIFERQCRDFSGASSAEVCRYGAVSHRWPYSDHVFFRCPAIQRRTAF